MGAFGSRRAIYRDAHPGHPADPGRPRRGLRLQGGTVQHRRQRASSSWAQPVPRSWPQRGPAAGRCTWWWPSLAGLRRRRIWAGIAGVLKATTGAHEVITTIMLNFIALRLLAYLLTTSVFQPRARTTRCRRPIPDSARLPKFSGDHAGCTSASCSPWRPWPWCGGCCDRSTSGFEFRAVGLNPSAARYAGMRTALVISLAMAIAGGLAGLAGATAVLGTYPVLTGGVAGSIGFDAITVALLGGAPRWACWARRCCSAGSRPERSDAGRDRHPDRHRHGHPGPDPGVRRAPPNWSAPSTGSGGTSRHAAPSAANWGRR